MCLPVLGLLTSRFHGHNQSGAGRQIGNGNVAVSRGKIFFHRLKVSANDIAVCSSDIWRYNKVICLFITSQVSHKIRLLADDLLDLHYRSQITKLKICFCYGTVFLHVRGVHVDLIGSDTLTPGLCKIR